MLWRDGTAGASPGGSPGGSRHWLSPGAVPFLSQGTMTPPDPPLPRRRTERLLTREVAGEVVVYDLDSHRAHCLSPAAARVWALADGRRTHRGALAALAEGLGLPDTGAATAVLDRSLDELAGARLLEPAHTPSGLDRRRLLAGVGAAALVTSVLVPTTAMTQSPPTGGRPINAVCMTSSQCTSGCCRSGRCKPGQGNCS